MSKVVLIVELEFSNEEIISQEELGEIRDNIDWAIDRAMGEGEVSPEWTEYGCRGFTVHVKEVI